jgi:hypothetical protein
MARTIRIDGTRDGRTFETRRRRSYYRTEAKWARKQTNRQTRNQTREVLTTSEDHDATAYPLHRSTGGWITH